jgi:hypothetical protein
MALGCARQQNTRNQMHLLQELALEDVKGGKPAAARKKLLAAARVGTEAGLAKDAAMAQTQMTLGALYAQVYNDNRRALVYMRRALTTDPTTVLPTSLAGPRARRALVQARALAARDAAAREPGPRPRPWQPAPAPPPPPQMAAAPVQVAPAPVRQAPIARNRFRARERARRAAMNRRGRVRDPVVELAPEEAGPARAAPVPLAAPEVASSARFPRPLPMPAPGPTPVPSPPPSAAPAAAQPPPAAASPPVLAAAPPPVAPAPPAAPAAPAEAPPAPEPPATDAPSKTAAASPVAVPPPRFPEGHTNPLYCPTPLEAPPEHEVIVRCAVRPDLRPGQLMLHYRPAGTEKFTAVSMPRAKRGFFQGVVPAEATAGKSLQFFVEAPGPAKINSGNADSPNILLLRAGAPPVGQQVPGDADKAAQEEASAEAERIRREDEDPLAASELKRELAMVRRRPAGKLWVGLGLGTGYGWQPGADLEFRPNRRIDAGPLAAGLAHALPEIGYQATDRLSLSVQARLQYAPVQGSGDPLSGNPRQSAMAFLLRGALSLGDGPLHGIATACVGGGKGGAFRLVVPASRDRELPRSDTVRGGPVVAGAGVGVVYHFNRRLALPLEARALAGFPDFAAVLEVGTGVAFTF